MQDNIKIADSLEQEFIRLLNLIKNKSLTEQDFENFCKTTIAISQTLYPKSFDNIEPITLKVEELKDAMNGCYYDSIVSINKNTLSKLQDSNSSREVINLINTIGHEVQHYNQDSTAKYFDSLPANEQEKIDESIKDMISTQKNYFRPKSEDIKAVHEMLTPYLNINETPKGYSSIEDYYEDVRYAKYNTIQIEKDAREQGIKFSKDLLNIINNSKYSSSELKDWYQTDASWLIRFDREWEDKYYKQDLETVETFKQSHNASVETVLKIIQGYEGSDIKKDQIEIGVYRNALKLLIEDKNLEQKQELLKAGIYNGFDKCVEILLNSIESEIDFKTNKELIQQNVFDCLTGNAYGENKKVDFQKLQYIDFSHVLNEQQLKELIRKRIEKEEYREAKNIISFSDNTPKFTEEEYINFLNGISNLKDNYRYSLSKAIIFAMPLEEKAKLLQNNDLPLSRKFSLYEREDIFESLKNSIKEDLNTNDKKEKYAFMITDCNKRLLQLNFSSAVINFNEKTSAIFKFLSQEECERYKQSVYPVVNEYRQIREYFLKLETISEDKFNEIKKCITEKEMQFKNYYQQFLKKVIIAKKSGAQINQNNKPTTTNTKSNSNNTELDAKLKPVGTINEFEVPQTQTQTSAKPVQVSVETPKKSVSVSKTDDGKVSVTKVVGGKKVEVNINKQTGERSINIFNPDGTPVLTNVAVARQINRKTDIVGNIKLTNEEKKTGIISRTPKTQQPTLSNPTMETPGVNEVANETKSYIENMQSVCDGIWQSPNKNMLDEIQDQNESAKNEIAAKIEDIATMGGKRPRNNQVADKLSNPVNQSVLNRLSENNQVQQRILQMLIDGKCERNGEVIEFTEQQKIALASTLNESLRMKIMQEQQKQKTAQSNNPAQEIGKKME